MEKITTTTELRQAIVQLEYERAVQKKLMKEQFQIAIDHLKPANIIRSTFKDLSATPGFMESIYGTTMGIASGYLTRKIIVGKSNNLFKNILGSILQSGVSSAVSKKPKLFLSVIHKVLNLFQKK